MRNRTPVPASERSPLPEFTPVPRKPRHDGGTPERQKAFIEPPAHTSAVNRASPLPARARGAGAPSPSCRANLPASASP